MQQLALAFDVEPAPHAEPEPEPVPGALVMVQLVPFATWHVSRRARRDRRLLLAAPALRFDVIVECAGPNLWHEPRYCSGTSRGTFHVERFIVG